MAIISLRQLLDHASENNYGVPAFNVNNLEQIRAIMEGANEVNSPVIVQASAGARKYAGPKFIKSMTKYGASLYRFELNRTPYFQIWSSLFKVGTSLAGAAGRNLELCIVQNWCLGPKMSLNMHN